MPGTLSATIVGVDIQTSTAALSGGGTLNTAVKPVIPMAAAFSGAGALAGGPRQLQQFTANLSGGGTLSGTGTQKYSSAAALSGAGTLSATMTGTLTAPTGIEILTSTATQNAGTRTPSVTFAGYTPQPNDVIAFWCFTTAATQGWTTSPAAGWVYVDSEASDANNGALYYHLVTSGEASGGTTTYSIANAYSLSTALNSFAVVLRGADPADVVDASATAFSSADTAATHNIAGVMTASSANGVWICGLCKDGTGAYGGAPAGWTNIISSSTNQARVLTRRTTLVSPGALSNVVYTTSGGDEYVSISAVFKPL